MNLSEEILKPLRFQEFKQTKSAPPRGLTNQSGQAVLEYILVLVVSVGLILGIMYQFSTALQKYVHSYFGDYVACLLETGELPSLGGDDTGGSPTAESCNSQYENFSLQNGRPLKESVGGDGTTAGSSSGSDGSSTRGSTNGSRGGSRGGSRSGGNGASRSASLNAEGGAASAAEGAQKNKRNFARGSAGGDGSGSPYMTQRLRNGTTYRLSSRFKTGEEKEKTVATKKVDAKNNAGGGSPSRQKIKLDDLRRKPASQGDASLELSFGDYLRYIIIFGILVVILVFFGGQLFQLRKSWDTK